MYMYMIDIILYYNANSSRDFSLKNRITIIFLSMVYIIIATRVMSDFHYKRLTLGHRKSINNKHLRAVFNDDK